MALISAVLPGAAKFRHPPLCNFQMQHCYLTITSAISQLPLSLLMWNLLKLMSQLAFWRQHKGQNQMGGWEIHCNQTQAFTSLPVFSPLFQTSCILFMAFIFQLNGSIYGGWIYGLWLTGPQLALCPTNQKYIYILQTSWRWNFNLRWWFCRRLPSAFLSFLSCFILWWLFKVTTTSWGGGRVEGESKCICMCISLQVSICWRVYLNKLGFFSS